MKKIFAVRSQPKDTDFVFLLLRLVVGIAFLYHGSGKIQSPLNWMGPDAPVPGIFQALAAISEFGGGLALVLGLLTRLGALGLSFTMAVAAFTHISRQDPFVGKGGPSWELAAVYLVIAIFFLVCGPGRFSLDRKIFGSR